MSKIILYDIAQAKQPGVSWSGNTLKLHVVLRYKGIPYETVWLSFSEIKANHERIGIKPGNGKMPYTCPAIKHGDVVMQDSFAIAEYLEKTFPDTPSVFPYPGIKALQTAMTNLFIPMFTSGVLSKLIFPNVPALLGEAGGADYFVRTRSEAFGCDLDKLCKPEEKPQLLQEFGKFVQTMEMTIKSETGGPWMAGKDFSWADALLLSWTRWIELCAPDAFQVIEAKGPAIMDAYRAGAKYYSFN